MSSCKQACAIGNKKPAGRQGTLIRKLARGLMLSVLFVIGFIVTGCQSTRLSHYVSPRVTGCVMNADTLRPIEGAKVMRISTGTSSRAMDPVKGAQALISKAPVTTSKDGCFAMDSIRSLTPFGRSGRYAVSLTFAHPDYERLSASYTLAKPSHVADEEPVIDVGEVLLAPRPKDHQ